MKRMYVVKRLDQDGEWRDVPMAMSNSRVWCEGFVAAMDGVYPSPPYRVVMRDGSGDVIMMETKGRAAPKLN